MEKTCSMCGLPKDLNDFHKNKNCTYGRASRCKSCTKKYWATYYKSHSKKYRDATKKWRIDNPDLFQDYGLRSRYKDFSLEKYNEILKKQSGVCAICGKPEKRSRKGKVYRLHVDHNHKTGVVRSLLCHNCNAGLGHFHDDAELLMKAYNYLFSDHDRHILS